MLEIQASQLPAAVTAHQGTAAEEGLQPFLANQGDGHPLPPRPWYCRSEFDLVMARMLSVSGSSMSMAAGIHRHRQGVTGGCPRVHRTSTRNHGRHRPGVSRI